MKPYYDIGGITIYHADCAEVLPNLSGVDLVATDPPYGLGEARKNRPSGRCKGYSVPASAPRAASWDDQVIDPVLMDQVVSAGKYAAVFGGNYYRLPVSPSWLVWDKLNGSTDFADAELIWTNYGSSVRLKRHRWNGMIRKGCERRDHPTQKPLELLSWVITLCPGGPQTVLDPFMGSGTTLRAAKDLGLRAVGIEREEQYCEIAAKRLVQEVLF